MFSRFYSLAFNPFDKTLESKHAILTKDFKEFASRMDYLTEQGGIGLICAAAGFGKTFAIRSWAAKQNRNRIHFSYACLSTVSTMEFYRSLCLGFGLEPTFRKVDMFHTIQEHLSYSAQEKGIKSVCVIDEAQYLKSEILRDLKMLTNFQMDSKNYLTLVLMGQPVLADLLMRPTNETLRQRIVVNYTFEGLGADEVSGYVATLIRAAGGTPDIIDVAATKAAYGASAGSIRKFNSIITAAIMIGEKNEAPSISADMVLSANEGVSIK
jgi:type II secretory pathway predicted ATPase ExeA